MAHFVDGEDYTMKYQYSGLNLVRVTIATMAAMLASSSVWAEWSPSGKDKTTQDRAAAAHVTKDSQASNWPALPERQAGTSYGQVIVSPFGMRERNFESGRR